MTRKLRTRASRPNYAALFVYDDVDGDGAGPSNARQDALDEEDSGSDFAPDQAAEERPEDDEDQDEDMDQDIGDEDEGATDIGERRDFEREDSALGLTKGLGRKDAVTTNKKKAVSLVPELSYPSNRQMYALPSMHHRHRAIPIHCREGLVERLLQCPKPFEEEFAVPTNSWSSNTSVTAKVNKSWGYNVGPGPLWELLEDRSWYKEALDGAGEEKEMCRRPRVHESITVSSYEILNEQDAAAYLPTDIVTTEEGGLKPPPPVACSFGPFGKQTRVEMHMFDARRIAEFIPGSRSHVFNAGSPVWGLDWCPIHPDDRAHYSYKQYLAVAPFPSRTHSPLIGTRTQKPAPSCIQLWALHPSQDVMDVDSGVLGGETSRKNAENMSQGDCGEMACEMVLCIDSGAAFELKWCPLPSNDTHQDPTSPSTPSARRKLGILAGTFEDGSLSLYAVPDPASVVVANDGRDEASHPIFVKLLKPLIRIELEETSCWALDWANSEVIAVGCTNGSIAVYNIAQALKAGDTAGPNILPTHYFTVHQSAIRSLAWIRAPCVSATGELTKDNPTVIASGGYDGVECLTDIRDLAGNVMNRTRDVVNSLCYSQFCGGPITIDHENIIKTYSVAPSMLGRGHTLLEPDGPAWV
ncbi:hypothetical protein AcW1_006148 [Taiwanofungus camphoratus]|nr:hypothetical protein AcW2_004910 [Antrodia cinnamomea]KAI0934716.1 hypothetical protein AcV5_006469 [Antrodia cinnamomea]KAI0957909.1 hypothetical protein AcW1_006148 [Antrodia cinnamomea]